MDVETGPEKLSNTEAATDNVPTSPWRLLYPGLQPNLHPPVPVTLSAALSACLSFLSL